MIAKEPETRTQALERLVARTVARSQGRVSVHPVPEFVTLDEYSDVVHINRAALWKKVYAGSLPGAGYVGRRIRIHWRSALGLKEGQVDGDPEILTVAQIAQRLRVKPNTIYELIKRGRLPGVLPSGKPYRVLWSAVVDWFHKGRGRVSRRKRR